MDAMVAIPTSPPPAPRPEDGATAAVSGTILVHVPTGGSPDALKAAIALASASGASILGVAAEGLDPFSVESEQYLTGEAFNAQMDAMRQRLRDAADHFDVLTRDFGEHTLCQWEESFPEAAMVRHAAAADWIVAARPAHEGQGAVLPDPAELIMRTGLPVLLIPAHPAPLRARRIVVGWRDARETRRAIAAAMPLLLQADEVTVVAVVPQGRTADARASLSLVHRRLAARGCNVRTEIQTHRRHPVGGALAPTAAETGADLIVVGGYSHSRLREQLLGGATDALISNPDVYVLFAH